VEPVQAFLVLEDEARTLGFFVNV
jgi:hypothetical protein